MNTGGLPIIISEYALADTDVRLFPASRHRSRRIRKKLIKRFGGEFVKEPVVWKTPEGIVMHPVRYAQFKLRMDYEDAVWKAFRL